MTFFSRSWFDRVFRRERETGVGAEAVRTRARVQEQSTDAGTRGRDVEEGASAARDEVVGAPRADAAARHRVNDRHDFTRVGRR